MVYPFSLSKSKLVLLHAVLHEYTNKVLKGAKNETRRSPTYS